MEPPARIARLRQPLQHRQHARAHWENAPVIPPGPTQPPSQWHTPTIHHGSRPQSSDFYSVRARDSLTAFSIRSSRRRSLKACVISGDGRNRLHHVRRLHRFQRLGACPGLDGSAVR
jgi:hypothetical protein